MLNSVRLLFLTAALGWAAAPALADQQAIEVEREGGNLVSVSSDDAAMDLAVAEARRTLPIFWDLFDAYPDFSDAFGIKVGLPTTDGELEHIWVYDLGHNGETFSGKIANEPFKLAGGVQKDDPVDFTVSEVTDWTIWSEGKQYGGYTVRVLADALNNETGRELRASLHDNPIPEFAE